MSKAFKDLMKEENSGSSILPPGLSLSKILNDIGKELKDQGAQGAHELASVLYRGDAFVLYPKNSQEQEQSQEQTQQKEAEGRDV